MTEITLDHHIDIIPYSIHITITDKGTLTYSLSGPDVEEGTCIKAYANCSFWELYNLVTIMKDMEISRCQSLSAS